MTPAVGATFNRATPPRVIVEFALEQCPRVWIRADSEGDEQRIRAWIATRPELLELVEHALWLAEEKRAA